MPFDMLVKAHQKGGDYAADAEQLAMIHVRRITHVFRRHSALIVAFACFVLAILATFAYLGYEMALAAFALAFPLMIVSAAEVLLAFRIDREGLGGEELRSSVTRRRFWNQVIGLFSIFIASLLMIMSLMRTMVLFY